MPNWSVGDTMLFNLLQSWLDQQPPTRPYFMNVYTNNYNPIPGDDFANYTLPTPSQWPGYSAWELPVAVWARVQVVEHVAQTYQPPPAVFQLPTGSPDLTIYGYVVCDPYLNFRWAEKFSAPVVVTSSEGVSIQPFLNMGIAPSPLLTFSLRAARRRVPVPVDDDEE